MADFQRESVILPYANCREHLSFLPQMTEQSPHIPPPHTQPLQHMVPFPLGPPMAGMTCINLFFPRPLPQRPRQYSYAPDPRFFDIQSTTLPKLPHVSDLDYRIEKRVMLSRLLSTKIHIHEANGFTWAHSYFPRCPQTWDVEYEVSASVLTLDDGEDEYKTHANDGSKDSNYPTQQKGFRYDPRGHQILGQGARNFMREMRRRSDINTLNATFLAIYESLIPAEEEKAKQKQLLDSLEHVIREEWPHARLFPYGSSATSFGLSGSDVDVSLALEDADVNKPQILLNLANFLKSKNFQNVEAVTSARVPVLKLLDPVTEISCDICINNDLAVENTKFLQHYAQIDERLKQLVLIIKHWAKARRINETYRGTLSSYCYALMCIHFLQQRKPAVLPCLQAMEPTYHKTVDGIELSYFDQVERIQKSKNKETLAELVWEFFHYWAHCHDYVNSVVSVRTGNIISKQEKEWKRSVGREKHLISVEDPFDISHDLGRGVGKFSIRILRNEFQYAAYVMQHYENPFEALFEPFNPD